MAAFAESVQYRGGGGLFFVEKSVPQDQGLSSPGILVKSNSDPQDELLNLPLLLEVK